MNNEEIRKKIIIILNKNFTEEWVVTPVYTTNDGKEIELPQELCEIFNDIVVQAVIPYFADALIAAGIGDISDLEAKREELRLASEYYTNELNGAEKRIKKAERRALAAERALGYACWDLTKYYGAKVRQEWADLKATQYKNKAEKELAEKGKDE